MDDKEKIKEKYERLTKTSLGQPVAHIQSLSQVLGFFYIGINMTLPEDEKIQIPGETYTLKSTFDKFADRDYSFDLGIIPPQVRDTIIDALATAQIRYVEKEDGRILLPLLDIPEDNLTPEKIKILRELIKATTPKVVTATEPAVAASLLSAIPAFNTTQALAVERFSVSPVASTEHLKTFIEHLKILYDVYGQELPHIDIDRTYVDIGKIPEEVKAILSRLLSAIDGVPKKGNGHRILKREDLTETKVEKFNQLVNLFSNPPDIDFFATGYNNIAKAQYSPHPLHLLALLTKASDMLPNGTSATISKTLPKFFREELKSVHDHQTLASLEKSLSKDPELSASNLPAQLRREWLRAVQERQQPKEKSKLTPEMQEWVLAFDVATRGQSRTEVLSFLIKVLQKTDPDILWPKSRDKLVQAFEVLKRAPQQEHGEKTK